jgi:glycosyltransferase involved in cell wall biosynthesis
VSKDVGQHVNADVVVVAEQLRRDVPGGIGTYVSELLGALAALPRNELPAISVAASRVRGPDPLERFGFPVATIAIPGRLIAKCWDLGFGKVRAKGLVHATSFALPPSAAEVVMTVHDLAFLTYPEAYPARGLHWHEAALRKAIDNVARFVVPAQHVAEQLARAGADPKAIHVIEEGSDHLPPADEVALVELLAKHGVKSDFLLAVGTLEPRKNLRRLVAAYISIRSSLPGPWPLVVVGPAGWGDAITPAEGVVLVGGVSSGLLSALYAAARLVCYVPIEEGFGLPVVEAMRAGTPVLSSAVPSAGGASILVDPLSEASIAAGLLLGASDETVRFAAIAAGNRRANDLTWRRCAIAHLGVWRQVLEKGAA